MIDYKSKLSFFIYFIASILLGLFLGVFSVYYFVGIDTETADNLKVLSYFFIGCATIIASIQLAINAKQAKYSNDWNKKQMAMIRLHESEKTIKEALKNLHKHLDVVGRDPEDPYQVYELHNKMGGMYELEAVKAYLAKVLSAQRVEQCYNLISNPLNRVNSPDKQYVACVTQGFEEQTTIDAIKKILSDNGYSSTENNIKVKAEEVCKIFQNSDINNKPRIPFYVLTLDKLI